MAPVSYTHLDVYKRQQQMDGMNAGTDVLNLQMDGKPVTGQDSLYASAVLDAPTGLSLIHI